MEIKKEKTKNGINKTAILVTIILSLAILGYGYMNISYKNKVFQAEQAEKRAERAEKQAEEEREAIEMPAEYFDEMNLVWKSDAVAYDGIFAPRTNPKPVETELHYSNETRELEPKTVNEALKEFPFPEFEELFRKIIEEYGSTIGGHYIGGVSIIGLEEFDIDTDGEKEKIAHFMGTGGNHSPHGADIIKDGKIVFSVSLDGGGNS